MNINAQSTKIHGNIYRVGTEVTGLELTSHELVRLIDVHVGSSQG